MANPTVKSGIAQESNLAFAIWVSPDVVGGSGGWDAKNAVRYSPWGTLTGTALGTSGKNGLASGATNCGLQLGPSNDHTGTPFDFTDVTWTVLLLCRPLNAGTTTIFQNRSAWSPNYGTFFDHSGTFLEGMFRGNATGVSVSSGSGVAVANQAMTLAMVCDATSLKVFKNGTQVASIAHSQTAQVYGSDTRIAALFNYAQARGASANPCEIFSCVGWNVALSAAELQTFGTTEAALLAGDFYTAAFEFGGGIPTLTVSEGVHGHTADPVVLSTLGTLTVVDGTHGHTTDSITLTAVSNGTITIPGVSDWETGLLKTGQTGVQVDIYNRATGALVIRKTGLATHATTADCVVFDAAIVASTTYRVVTLFADGSLGVWDYTAA